MNIMLLISQNIYRKNTFLVSFIVTFIIIILINPYNIFSVGMWLSFLGTLGIVMFQKFLIRFIECKFKAKSKILIVLLNIVLVSLSAQILILPVMIYTFNTFSLTFFISNLLIYFLIGPILAIGYISILSGIIFTPIGKFIAILENFLVAIILKIAELCSKIPLSKIYMVTPSFFNVIIYYAVIAMIVFIFFRYKFKFLRFILGKGLKNFVSTNIKKIIVITLCITFTVEIYNKIPQKLEIHFVDVSQRRLYCNKK